MYSDSNLLTDPLPAVSLLRGLLGPFFGVSGQSMPEGLRRRSPLHVEALVRLLRMVVVHLFIMSPVPNQ